MHLKNCYICDGDEFESILDLGEQPLSEHLSNTDKFPLHMIMCKGCGLYQLNYIVNHKLLFPESHPYATRNSKKLVSHYNDIAARFFNFISKDDLVVDIGCNDGTLLSKFKRGRKVGVDPTDQIKKVDGNIYQGYFSKDMAKRIRHIHGGAKLVFANNVLAHVPDPNDFLAGVDELLLPDGLFVTQNHNVESVLSGQWDAIYHEHLRYFSPHTLRLLLNKSGLVANPSLCRTIDVHGGSFEQVAQKKFSERVKSSRQKIIDALEYENRSGNRVYGVGATTRAGTILNYCGIDNRLLSCVCEVSNSDKIGSLIAGTNIPVIDENHIFEDKPECLILLSWHLKDSILPILYEKGYRGRVIVPLPELLILSGES